MTSSLGEERLAQLRQGKLRALVSSSFGVTDLATSGFPDGASGLSGAGRGFLLSEQAGPRTLGAAMIWAARHDVGQLDLLISVPPGASTGIAGRLARQAHGFARPDITVHLLIGTALEPIEASPSPAAPSAPTAAELACSAGFIGSGLDLVVEHGRIQAEVLGLEVARVVANEHAGEGPTIEVGIGRFDREVGAMMHAGRPTGETIAAAAALVRRHRVVGGPTHPLRDLVPERWIRHWVIEHPESVGAAELVVCDTTLEPTSLKERQPAAASGCDLDGRPLLVVCSSGVDPDLVPLAGDTRSAWHPEARLVLVVAGAPLPVTAGSVASLLVRPAELVVVPLPWSPDLH